MLKAEYGLTVDDLYQREGLARVDGAFLEFLEAADAGLKSRLEEGRGGEP